MFTFVDLFAGVGGFHAALGAMGGVCVYAVEIDKAAAEVYRRNWGYDPLGDVTKDAGERGVTSRIAPHDVLVAGFPCQPFSKSGAQKGMDEARGTLFFNIMQVIDRHHPAVVVLENVRNLAGPRHSHEWEVIVRSLRQAGYRVSDRPAVISPHDIAPERGGRPQARERVFITATYDPQGCGSTVQPVSAPRQQHGNVPTWDVTAVMDKDEKGYRLTPEETRWVSAWDTWVQAWRAHNPGAPVPSFPVWVDAWVDPQVLDAQVRSGAHRSTPGWKMRVLRRNSEMFAANSRWMQPWRQMWDVDQFPASRRKLEWQAQDTLGLWDCVMQLRPSGLRAKAATYLPALVAITQTSIVGPVRRRITPREAARLQGLPDSFTFGDQKDAATYRQMGNGVNVGAVWNILKLHCQRDRDVLLGSASGRRVLEAVEAAPANPDDILGRMRPGADGLHLP